MRALSLRQPFAWLTVHAGKNPENRTWLTGFRGWFLIHASAQWHQKDLELAQDLVRRLDTLAERRAVEQVLAAALRDDLEVGGIIGAAKLETILPPQSPQEVRTRWRLPDQYGYVLNPVVVLPFTPCKGLQRFWRVKPETAEELRLRIPPWLWLELQKND